MVGNYIVDLWISIKKVPRKIIVVNDIPMISTIFSVLMFDIPIMDHLLGRTFFPMDHTRIYWVMIMIYGSKLW